MDCLSALEARNEGRSRDAAVSAHLARCPLCAIGSQRPPGAAPAFDAVERGVASERGVLGTLRGLPTWGRLGLALGVAAALLLATGAFAGRDLTPLPGLRILAWLLLALGLGLLLRENLLPLQAPRRPLRQRLLVALGVTLPAALAFLPVPAALRLDALPGVDPAVATGVCLFAGCLVGGVLLLLLRALDRGAHRGAWSAGTAAAAGGLVGVLALDLHCPITAFDHLLVGHGGAGLALALVYGAIAGLRRPAG